MGDLWGLWEGAWLKFEQAVDAVAVHSFAEVDVVKFVPQGAEEM